MARSDKLTPPEPHEFAAALRRRLHYDPLTGRFHFRKNGKRAGCLCKREGYVRIRLWNVLYHAHRLAWVYMTGDWPEGEIDHRNRVRDDNRWANLREATRAQNSCNKPRARRNTSGVKGVSWDESRGRWRATIQVNGRWKQIGRFHTKEEAAAAYVKAAQRLQGPFFPRDLSLHSTVPHATPPV